MQISRLSQAEWNSGARLWVLGIVSCAILACACAQAGGSRLERTSRMTGFKADESTVITAVDAVAGPGRDLHIVWTQRDGAT